MIARVLLLLAFASPLIAQDTFTVGTASAARGQKASGAIEVPAGVDAALSIPVVVVNGARRGPVLALVSGAHGTEYASIIALERVIERLDPAAVSGTVIILPLVNVNSFEKKVPHVNPIDGKSMNRFYPGRIDGTQTERASYLITKNVVDRCDYLIDLHGGDIDESLRPYSYWVGCFNVMRQLKMLAGTVTPVENPVWLESVQSVTSDATGIFYPLVKRGTYVSQGMKIGYVTDYVGRTILEARAPAAGVVTFIRAVPSMTKGETIASIGVIAKQ